MTEPSPLPRSIDWQLTFACQLRCTHCYTESGRRAARKLPRRDLLQIADTLVAMQVQRVNLVGGEPTLVPELLEIVERLRAGGIPVSSFTNGQELRDDQARALARLGAEVHVSVDGATPEINDAIRGRPGGFAAVLRCLRLLDDVARAVRERGEPRFRFGLDVVLVRSNFFQLRQICAELIPAFPEMAFASLGAVIPIGLASEEKFAEAELLTEEQLQQLSDQGFLAELRALMSPTFEYLSIFDNQELQVHTRWGAMSAVYRHLMEIEPDGGVRGFAACEGTIGNILHDPPELLWERCRQRIHDPMIVESLSAVQTPPQWAAAVRAIDRKFAAPEALHRLGRRAGARP